jgi:alkylresorcinol/alkylpyrone synthase
MLSRVRRILITEAASARLPRRVAQADAAAQIAKVIGDERRIAALSRSTRIDFRSIAVPEEQIAQLTTVEDRNGLYQQIAPKLAAEAVAGLTTTTHDIDFLVTSSCTGYMVPGLDVWLAQSLGMHPTAGRLPITEAGCAGGVVALARAVDFLRTHQSGKKAIVAAVELCSLAFQRSNEPGNLTATLIFGDGAAAVSLEAVEGGEDGMEVIDSASMLVPDSRDAIGFDLTDEGFAPRLSREVADMLPGPISDSISRLLAHNGLALADLAFWLVHPGGPRILQVTRDVMGLTDSDLRWSWDSLREQGNMSSVAILDVMRRFLCDPMAPKGPGLLLAFGPGVSLELMLLQRC